MRFFEHDGVCDVKLLQLMHCFSFAIYSQAPELVSLLTAIVYIFVLLPGGRYTDLEKKL